MKILCNSPFLYLSELLGSLLQSYISFTLPWLFVVETRNLLPFFRVIFTLCRWSFLVFNNSDQIEFYIIITKAYRFVRKLNGDQASHCVDNRELKQPQRRKRQKRHKFAYLTMKNSSFARFARAFFIFVHFANVHALSKTLRKWPVLPLCGRLVWARDRKFPIWSSPSSVHSNLITGYLGHICKNNDFE